MAQSHIFKGNLKGYVCDDCLEGISNATIRLYHPSGERDLTASAVAETKETFRALTADAVNAKQKQLVAEGRTDEEGNFEIKLGDSYNEGAFEIDFVCGNVPRGPHPHQQEYVARQFHLTTAYPKWIQSRIGLVFSWSYALPARWWCFIRGHFFDAWVICGHLTDCKTGAPLAGFTVTAMDADWLTDDLLGSDVTDSSGHFRIDYTSADFKKTFLSPWINIETDVSFPFTSGPDVYFKLAYNGTQIQLETSANRRTNVGHCLCVSLCLSDFVIPPSQIPAAFTHIGKLGHHAIVTGIDATTGQTLGGYAFYSSLNLVGMLNQKLNGLPMEYMFEYQSVATPATAPTPGGWLPVTPAMVNETIIGSRFDLTGDIMNPYEFTPYAINQTTPGYEPVVLNGNWIKMPQIPNFAAHQDAEILSLNTAAITGTTTIDLNGMVIGSPTVPAIHAEVRDQYVALRMRQRQVGNASTEVVAGTSRPIALFNVRYDNVPQRGSWAPTKINGALIAASLDVNEVVEGAGGCGKITTAIHVKYNARHQHLDTVALTMEGPTIANPALAFSPITVSRPETVSTGVGVTPTLSVAALPNCAYLIKLTATVKLTNGENPGGTVEDYISICKG